MARNPLLRIDTARAAVELCTGAGLLALALIAPVAAVVLACRHRRAVAGIVGAGALAVLADAFLLAPNRLTVTRLTLPLPALAAGARLRLVHLSDLHLQRPRRFFQRVVRRVAAEAPDLIVVTGDLLQEHPRPGQQELARGIFRQLAAVAPLVMIPGGHDLLPIPEEPAWTLLRNAACRLKVRGVPLQIIGWDDFAGDPRWRPPAPAADRERVNILLVHSPDWFDHAAALGADLALAGHTHGGQVRLPGWGAVVTASQHGKRFEYGLYRLGLMWAFVTRGLAQNPWPAPPLRFLCPPEIAVLTLVPGLDADPDGHAGYPA